MKRTLFTFAAILTLLVLAFPAASVLADVAPPESPPGSSIDPGTEVTQVRMLAETVVLNVSTLTPNSDWAVADTVATFTMRNLGTSEEKMQARFPLSFLGEMTSSFPEISSIAVNVDGKPVTTQRLMQKRLPTEATYLSESEEIPWAVFDVTFPAGKDVTIEVRYRAEGFGYYPYQTFKYILETGAGWKDTIGSADIILRLPYEATNNNAWMPEEGVVPSETTPGAVLQGREVRWHFEELEPTWENNIQVTLVTPVLWQKVLNETNNVTKNPNDGEAWGRLGKAYKEIIMMPKGYLRDDPAGLELYELSKQAYEKCLALLPKDSLWHAGYADLLWARYYFQIYWPEAPDPEGLYARILTELKTAIVLNPNNQLAKELLEEIRYSVPGSVEVNGLDYDFLGLTATPIRPTPWFDATETPVPTETAVPASSTPTIPATVPSPIATIAPPPGAPPSCPGAALILPVLFGMVWLSKRKTTG
jgi:hypothetical protein